MSGKKTDFSEICVYNSKLDGSEFVGLAHEGGSLKVCFPLGYARPRTDDAADYRKDILNLISVLSEFPERQDSFIQDNKQQNRTNADFPIHAYLYLITDYLNHGYYAENDIVYKRAAKGKISWKKTVRQITPKLVDDEIVFFDFITRNVRHDETQLITQIHRYCVHESFEKIGFLFSDYMPQKPSIQFNARLFTSVLQTRLSRTFNERQQFLFSNMLDIIRFLDNSKDSRTFYYGTENFAYVWERLVDTVYGIKDKEKFYPHCWWNIGGKKIGCSSAAFMKYALRPDTIMITGRGNHEKQKIFVLDSKYYKYGESSNFGDLPVSDSIIKQIAYAQFIDKKEQEREAGFEVQSQRIYNAFILPFGAEDSGTLKYLGYATSDYVGLLDGGEKEYHRIHGILLDIKTLMYAHGVTDNAAIKALAEIIERGREG